MREFKVNPPFRQATFDDVVFIARLLKEFYTKAGSAYGITYDHETMLITTDDAIRQGICIVGPTSCAAAFLELFPANCDRMLANVKFWYFQNHKEIVIFEELARICGDLGASDITGSSHAPSHVIGRYYERIGLQPVETVYLGRIENCCKSKSKRVRAEA